MQEEVVTNQLESLKKVHEQLRRSYFCDADL
jgi:hypothetical protein